MLCRPNCGRVVMILIGLAMLCRPNRGGSVVMILIVVVMLCRPYCGHVVPSYLWSCCDDCVLIV
jgi:hypothetical protein